MRIALRRSDGARVIQLPSGCMPMISECACWAIWRISVSRYVVRHRVARLDALVGGDEGIEVVPDRARVGPRAPPTAS